MHGMIVNPMRTYRRRVLRELGSFAEHLRYGVDYEMALRVGDRYGFACVPEILYCQRIHGGNTQQTLPFRNLRSWWHRAAIVRQLRRGRGRLLGRGTTATYATLGAGLIHVTGLPARVRSPWRHRG